MALFDAWCDLDETKAKRKRLWRLTERDGARVGIQREFAETMRSHYDRLQRIAEDVDRSAMRLLRRS